MKKIKFIKIVLIFLVLITGLLSIFIPYKGKLNADCVEVPATNPFKSSDRRFRPDTENRRNDEYPLTCRQNGADKSISLVSLDRGLCWLSYVEFEDLDNDRARCSVEKNATKWTLNCYASTGDPDAECMARCVTWR